MAVKLFCKPGAQAGGTNRKYGQEVGYESIGI